jgi:Ca2+-dependent lipid-binding protein
MVDQALIDQVLLETRKCTVHTHMQGDSVVALEENAKEFEMMRTAVTAKLILKSNTNNDFEEVFLMLNMYMYTYIYIYICTHTYIYICILYVYVYICIYAYHMCIYRIY